MGWVLVLSAGGTEGALSRAEASLMVPEELRIEQGSWPTQGKGQIST